MNRPRLKLGLDASRSTLNEPECARIGLELARIRERRGLSIEKVGASLLLASRQVTALEQVQLQAFYGAELYVAALKKYAVLMGLDPSEVDRALIGPALTDLDPASRRGRKTMATAFAGVPEPSKRFVVGAAVVVSVVIGSLLLAAVRQQSSVAVTPVPRQQLQHEPVLPASASQQTLPAAPEVAETVGAASRDVARAAAAETVSDEPDRVHATTAALAIAPPLATTPAAGRVRVGQPTWVFVRYANGTTLERVLGRGEVLTLQERPTYLAVGSADETVVELDGQAIDNSPFIVNGALRVGSSQLAQLVARR